MFTIFVSLTSHDMVYDGEDGSFQEMASWYMCLNLCSDKK